MLCAAGISMACVAESWKHEVKEVGPVGKRKQ